MGYYLETNTLKNKADLILERLDGRQVTQDEAKDALAGGTEGAVICVVDNGPFEAAAYCYNLDTFRQFTYAEDDRPKTWLLIDNKEEVERLTGYSS